MVSSVKITRIKRIDGIMNNVLLYSGNYTLVRLASISPEWVEVRVTESCNSRCVTCGAWKNSQAGELTTAEMVDALGQLRKIGVRVLRISGGEPLLRADLPEIVREARLLGFSQIEVATNGLLLEQKAERLLQEGVTRFDVSIDGIGDTDDRIRGVPGHYSLALAGIRKVKSSARKMGKTITVNVFTTLLKQNISEVPAIIAVCEKVGAHWCFSLLCGNIDFFNKMGVSQFAPKDWKMIDRTLDYVKKLYYEKGTLIFSTPDVIEYARHYMKGDLNVHDFPCVLGYKILCLGARGGVYPGCYVNEPLGNVREMKIEKILKSRDYRKSAEKMYRRECIGCTFAYEDNVIIRNALRRTEKIREVVKSK
jgi:MoaA/NifB/PqqE/SkfB family radical SAM enzyme